MPKCLLDKCRFKANSDRLEMMEAAFEGLTRYGNSLVEPGRMQISPDGPYVRYVSAMIHTDRLREMDLALRKAVEMADIRGYDDMTGHYRVPIDLWEDIQIALNGIEK